MKIGKIALAFLAAVFSACTSVTGTPVSSLKFAQSEEPVKLVKIINHKAPDIQVDKSPFTDAGCSATGITDHGYMSEYDCKEGGPLHDLGCDTMIHSPLLGGLNPNDPTVICRVDTDGYPYLNNFADDDLPSEGCIDKNSTNGMMPCYHPVTYQYREGRDGGLSAGECLYSEDIGLIISCYFLVTYREGKYQLVNTQEDFRTLFAPVDSAEEALGFALANNDYFAQYGQTRHANYAYFVENLEDTHVEATAEGYVVHLFSAQISSCSDPLNTGKSVEIKVTYAGYVSEINSFSVYSDPSLTGCE